MARQHMCKGKWAEGAVASCQVEGAHGRSLASQPEVKGIVSKKEKRQADQRAGTIGHDSGAGFYRDGPG